MRLYLFRLSLSKRSDPDLFEENQRRPSRTEFLRDWLGEGREFEGHGGIRLHYVPSQVDDNLISGVIGRWVTQALPADPGNIWVSKEQNHWEKAPLFANIDPHDQVVGLELNHRVGRPSSLMKSFATAINEASPRYGWKVDAFPITSTTEFLAAISRYPAPITSVTFDLVTPNPTDAAGATARALKRLRKRINADRYKGTPSNKDGLDLQNDPFVKDAAGYAASGGGDIKAKSDKKVVYDSKEHISSVEVPDEARPTGEKIEGLPDMLTEKLKR